MDSKRNCENLDWKGSSRSQQGCWPSDPRSQRGRSDSFTHGGEHSHHTLHQVIVLGELLRCRSSLNVAEERHQNILRKWLDVLWREEQLAVPLESKNAFDSDRCIGACDVLRAFEMLNEQGEDRKELFFGELVSESVKILDRVDLQDRAG